MKLDEFSQGYLDGRDPDAPEPSANRSHRYRHSFAVGRAEIAGKTFRPIATYEQLLAMADAAEAKDISQ